jgi:uncharacterized membrane protein HdeD (DUF308 family)
VTDIFFSYSSQDRERVRPIRDALVAQGFEVFWDQQVPAGMDWDTWIRQHLTKSKCAMAFWSPTSVSSDNVRHEAMVAKQQGKLISVLLEPLTAEQFPMGVYAQQAANLSGWNGDYRHDEWRKFRREFEAKLTPLWVRMQIDEIEAELVGERARREGAERRDRVLQAQIAKEAEVQQELKQERDKALDEVVALKATVEKLTRTGAVAAAREAEAERRDRALQAQIAKEAEAYQDLTRERDKALDEVAALKATVGELTQARADAEATQAEAQEALKLERDSVLDEVAALRTSVEELTDAEAKQAEAYQDLTRERDQALDEVAALKATVGELTQARADAEAQVRGLKVPLPDPLLPAYIGGGPAPKKEQRRKRLEPEPQPQRAGPQSVQKRSVLFLVEGIILVVLGVLAIIIPPLARIVVTIFLGWLFLISGIVGLVTTFWARHAPGFWWSLLSAVLAIAAGIVLLGWPVRGAVSLTLLLIVFFIIEGVLSIMYAFAHKKKLSARWGWMLVSGIIDLILAAIIWGGLPGTAEWALGLLVGINMLFGGSAMIAMALHARKTANTSSHEKPQTSKSDAATAQAGAP